MYPSDLKTSAEIDIRKKILSRRVTVTSEPLDLDIAAGELL